MNNKMNLPGIITPNHHNNTVSTTSAKDSRCTICNEQFPLGTIVRVVSSIAHLTRLARVKASFRKDPIAKNWGKFTEIAYLEQKNKLLKRINK